MSRNVGIVEEFCDDNFKQLSDVPKAHTLYAEYLKKCQNLESQLSFVSTEVPTNINSALQLAQNTVNRSSGAIIGAENLIVRSSDVISTTSATVSSVEELVFGANEFDKYIKYFKWILEIQDINGSLEKSLEDDQMDQACKQYTALIQKFESLDQNTSGCLNLAKYIGNTITFWHNKILHRLEPEFLAILKAIGWPFLNYPAPNDINELLKQANLSGSSSQRISSSSNKSYFEKIFCNLLILQLPQKLIDDGGTDPSKIVLLPIKLMVKPLIKRFQYHFSGNKPSNVIGKPEWYLTQVLNWISNHYGILGESIEPFINVALGGKYSDYNAIIMFTQSLLSLVSKKLNHDLDILLTDDVLFAHLVDELLLFDRELSSVHWLVNVALKNDGPVNILCQPKCLQKWVNTEKLCALNRLDEILSKPEAWAFKYNLLPSANGGNKGDTAAVDDDKVPESTDLFVTMLLTITDRYKTISSWKDQLRFLDLQIHLLDDYRIRLTQVLKNETLTNPLGKVHFAVINAAHYVANLLHEWSENLFFLELQQKSSTEHLNESDITKHQKTFVEDEHSFFKSILLLYKRLYTEACEYVNTLVVNEFKNKSRIFVDNNWLMRPSHNEKAILTISRSACPMLQMTQQKLTLLETNLSIALFTLPWRNIAEMIDIFLFKELILGNQFSAEGCQQVEFDLVRNLFPLFGCYTQKPENYFRRLKESCTLLTMSKGSAMLLLEVLDGSSHARPIEALKDLKISLLNPADATLILNLRVDLMK